MTNRPKPVTFVDQVDTDTAETQAPEPLLIVGSIPGVSAPAAATPTVLGTVKQAAHVANATDATDVITNLNLLLAALQTAGVVAAS